MTAVPRVRWWTHLLRQPPLSQTETRCVIAVTVGGVCLAALPGWLSPYALATVRDALVLAILALSLDFLWGRAHVLSLGHATFFGLGAYGMAIATTRWSWGSEGALALGIGAAALVAWVVGYFLIFAGVRLHFFAIITIALSLIVGQIAVSWSSLTGGDVGILGVPGLRFDIAGLTLDLGSKHANYYACLIAALAVLGALWLACRAPYGKILHGIGTNEFRAQTLGHDSSLHLLLVFVVSAAIAGFAGALFAASSGVVAPDLFSMVLSTEIIVWVAVGGRGTLLGPVIATLLLTRLQLEISSLSTSLWPLILGSIFVLLVIFLPDGLPAVARMLRRGAPARR